MAELELRGVSKSYESKQVLDSVDLHVADGTFCAILGPSGSGKTTLLRLVAGFASVDAGELRLGQANVTGIPPEQRDIGVVFQSYALFPHMTVFENVAFGLRMRRLRRRDVGPRVRRMLELVRLGGMEERRPAQLSGGQQQRVAVARALVIEPKLLLLDEPLSALDRKIREEMRSELKRIHRETGLTTVLVTHDQEEALDLAERLLILSEGRVRQHGPPGDVYRHPADAFVADFMGSVGLPDGRLQRRGDGWFVCIGDVALPVRGCSPHEDGDLVRVALQPEHVSLAPALSEHGGTVGVLRTLSFSGSVARAAVDCGEIVLPALMLSTNARDLAEGQRVRIDVDPTGVHVFDASGVARPERRGPVPAVYEGIGK